MADRIISMRDSLYNSLTNRLQTPGEWGHIKSQIGMFRYYSDPHRLHELKLNYLSFTGLNQDQAKSLAQKAHVYMTLDGRISMAGLNGQNIDYFAESVDAAVRGKL
jgi:aspartate aminotransferase